MQYIPCNSALLAQETLLLTQNSTFLPKVFQKVRKLRQISTSQQNSEYQGFKFVSESFRLSAHAQLLLVWSHLAGDIPRYFQHLKGETNIFAQFQAISSLSLTPLVHFVIGINKRPFFHNHSCIQQCLAKKIILAQVIIKNLKQKNSYPKGYLST